VCSSDLERALHAELRLDEAATLAADVTAQTEANAAQLAATLDLTATIADRLAAQGKRLDQLASRMQAVNEEVSALHKAVESATAGLGAQGQRVQGLESRLEQGVVQAGSTAAQVTALRKDLEVLASADQARDGVVQHIEQRTEQLAAQLAGAAEQVATMRRDLEAGHAQARSASERQARTEQRLERLDAAMPERLARLETRLDDLNRLTRSVIEMAAQNEIRSNGKVAFSTLLTEDKTLYPLNLQALGPKDRAALDDLVKRLKAMGKDYHLEIQGHTDNIGVDDYNYLLGKARAEVVKRYLHDQGGIPLSWMSVISYGATQPLDPRANNNRRILIQTLVLDSN
jgi:outer membrane protein OmpA-like peptidoglycan-associated protein